MRFACFIFVLLACPVFAEWRQHHEEDGVTILLRDVEGSKYKEFKASVVINTTPANALALLQDNAACPRWVNACESSNIIEEISKTERIFHQITNLPFPAKSRDAVFHGVVEYNNDNSISIILSSAHDKIPPTRNVRIIETRGRYDIEPLDNGAIRFTWQHFVDPAGSLPAWIVNSMMTNLPFKSLQAFRTLVKEEPYSSAEFTYGADGVPVDIRFPSSDGS